MAVILTHDVESEYGLKKCIKLAELEMKLGFRSSFNFVTERYNVPDYLRRFLYRNGFEIGVHGLYHDGKLFQTREIFKQRAKIINQYLKKWNAVGFRAPSMHHNLEWMHELNISYDLSTFDHDPFEPQSDGVSTIFPFWVCNKVNTSCYLELPYTLAQDFTLFVLMKEKTTRIWQQKLHWIYQQGGMALLNTHPDYMSFPEEHSGVEQYPVTHYIDFLKGIESRYDGQYWHGRPRDLFHYHSRSLSEAKLETKTV